MNITAEEMTTGPLPDPYSRNSIEKGINTYNLDIIKFITSTMTDPLFILNETGSFLEINNAASEILRYTKNEILSRSISKIDPRLSGNNWLILSSRIREKGTLSEKACHITGQDSIIPLEMTWKYFKINNRNYYIGIARYTKGNKNVYNDDFGEIIKNTDHTSISDEVETLFNINNIDELKNIFYRLLEEKKNSVEEAKFKALGDLISGIAHEINTPLGNAITLLSYLKDEIIKHNNNSNAVADPSTASLMIKTTEYSDSIMQNLARSSSIIDRFRDAASASNDDKKTVFNIRDTVYAALYHLYDDYKINNHSIEIYCPTDLVMTGYKNSFLNIVTQLFHNSLIHAFTEKNNGKSKIKIKQNDNYLEIDYTDNGKGLTEEERKKIFEPFFTTKRGQGCTGLGMFTTLSIIKRKMKGSIKCYSSEGSGTLFRIIIPLNEDSGQQITF